MKKVLLAICKVLLSILVFPFAFVGGFLYGIAVGLCCMFVLPFAAISDIWEKE